MAAEAKRETAWHPPALPTLGFGSEGHLNRHDTATAPYQSSDQLGRFHHHHRRPSPLRVERQVSRALALMQAADSFAREGSCGAGGWLLATVPGDFSTRPCRQHQARFAQTLVQTLEAQQRAQRKLTAELAVQHGQAAWI
jgi:hypothetical protein